MAMLAVTMAAVMAAIAPITMSSALVLSCRNVVKFRTSGSSFSMTGINAAPMLSFSSSIWMPKFFRPPSALLAKVSAAPPTELLSACMISSALEDESITPLSDGSSLISAVVWPAKALDTATLAVSMSMFLAVARSAVTDIAFWDNSSEPVARTRFAKAGRS